MIAKDLGGGRLSFTEYTNSAGAYYYYTDSGTMIAGRMPQASDAAAPPMVAGNAYAALFAGLATELSPVGDAYRLIEHCGARMSVVDGKVLIDGDARPGGSALIEHLIASESLPSRNHSAYGAGSGMELKAREYLSRSRSVSGVSAALAAVPAVLALAGACGKAMGVEAANSGVSGA